MKLSRVLAASLAVALCATADAPAQSNEFRGIWVDAWGTGFLNASQVTQLLTDCRTYHFNAVVVQMRRRGDAFYTPGITSNDPKTTAIAANFDALQDIITKAHDTSGGKKRIEVHCWVTTHVIWSSETSAPSQPGHVFNTHPEYLMQDSAGNRFIGEGYYLDPGHPGATLWNYVMATNIVRRYDVDGFHWDYVRYPAPDSGYNATAIARYNAEFGLTGQPSSGDTQFSNWRRRQVTDFLRWVNSDLLALKPQLIISCSVFGSRSDAFNARFQDWAAWNNEGVIDLCMPMGYTSDNALFQSRVTDAFNNQGVRRVYGGQGAYLNTKENTVTQLAYIRSKPLFGSMLYSYRVPNSGTVDRAGTLTHVRDNHQPTWVDAPAIPWKATPTKAIIRGMVTRQSDGAAVYNATLTIDTSPVRNQKAEPHGAFAFFETPPGTYTITATATDLGAVTTNVTLTAGTNRGIALALPPDSTPPLFSFVGTSNLTDTSVIIKWLTDENATSAVDYGTTTAYGSTISNATLKLNHALSLTGLTPNTTYHYRVRSRNSTGLQNTSSDLTFTSNPPGVVNDVIIEARLAGGGLNSNPPYSDAGFADSTLKSSAAGLTGTGSRYGSSGSPSFIIRPSLPMAGGRYDVYLTHGIATSISDDIVVSVDQTGCSGLPVTTTIFREPGANSWEYLGRLTVNSGVTVPTLTFTHSSGLLSGTSRMYSDSIKFVFAPPPQPPIITNQPSGLVLNQGTNATFTVSAAGAMPLSYQWRFEGTNLAGATQNSYTRANVQSVHEGDYSVVITNVAGSVTSAVAFLVVNLPPSIAVQPQAQSVEAGRDAAFSVAAGGTEPLQYQWRFHGTNLFGATASDYTRITAQTNHAGPYSVIVSNSAGSIASSNALLTVNYPLFPPEFQTIERLLDGRVRLVITGTPGTSLWLDRASNLADWETVTNLFNPGGALEFMDSGGDHADGGFYRLRQ